jgi:hypothetical protein
MTNNPMPVTAAVGLEQGSRLVGVWALDEGYQISELLFRSDGRYQMDTRSSDPAFDYSTTERGRYAMDGQILILSPYDYFGEPYRKRFACQPHGESLSLTTLEYPHTQVYQLKPGSTADVLAREQVEPLLLGTWRRHITFYGTADYTFRPGGYFLRTNTPEGGSLPPELLRGRYEHDGTRLTLTPYSGTGAPFELDFFGNVVTLIKVDEFYGESATYEQLPGSADEVRAKSAERDAFLARTDWHVGTWEIRDALHSVDLTVRPDGRYVAEEYTEFLAGIVRGRYVLEPGRLHLRPFVGQGPYARSNGEFGKVDRIRELDYYDGELQLIDLEALSQSVTVARKRPGSDAAVTAKVGTASAERGRAGWHLGTWEANGPAGWMEFTLRPDNRYVACAGADGVPGEVERGRYVLAAEKLTLAPYAGLGPARGFELDFYDGDLFLIGDLQRMVVVRKVPGSDRAVIGKTVEPESMRGELGGILGLWTANLPGESAALVFRPDGEFRLNRCAGGVMAHDYGLYAADMDARTLLSDSRFIEQQACGLDFYGDTMTIFGGSFGPPRTYTVNPGVAAVAIEESLAADAEEALVDAQWLERVPIGLRREPAAHMPVGDIPADPNPSRTFDAPAVLEHACLYRRLSLGFAYFNVQGAIRTVPVTNTREWYFFPNGRTLIRFRNYRAGLQYPTTVADVTDSWGAYRVEPPSGQRDVLHRYADNVLVIETDLGEAIEMTLEDGRRHLFWNKDFQLLSEWAAAQVPEVCQLPETPDPRLMNTGLSLSTVIEPDDSGPDAGPDPECLAA